MSTLLALAALGLALQPEAPAAGTPPKLPEFIVHAIGETEPVEDAGDAADDPAIWVHPTDGARSMVLGTNKKSGLGVYALTGQEIQFLPVGRVNNVDLAQDEHGTLVVAGQRDTRELVLWKIDTTSRRLKPFLDSSPPGGVAWPRASNEVSVVEVGVDEPYGVCCARIGNYTTVLVNDKNGWLEEWKVNSIGAALIGRAPVRTLKFDSQTEGMVIDAHHQWAFVGEEAVGIWKISLDPTSTAKELIAAVSSAATSGHLFADVEGLTIADTGNGNGYLICSNQGDNSFTVHDRKPPHAAIARFRIAGSGDIDGVTETDGIDATTANLGGAFAKGLFVAQDGENTTPEGTIEGQNFKFIPWSEIQAGIDAAKR